MDVTKMTEAERVAMLVKLEGQSQWNWWSNRVDFLENTLDTMEHWASSEDITKVCTGMPGVRDALAAELGKARAHLATLAEFAPAPKGRKKK